MRSEVRWVIVVLAVLGSVSAGAAEVPVAVSPGDASKLARIGDPCPTFSWDAVERATTHELVVYKLGEEGQEAKVVLRQQVSGSASSWTPSLEHCLQRGGQYVWSVRAVGRMEASEWSAPSLFEVSAGPTAEQFQEALAVLRTYLASQDGAIPSTEEVAEVERGGAADSEPTEKAAAPGPRAASPTALKVDQGIEAASFTGDGSALTNLGASNLASGTVAEARGGTGIDSSGTASGSLLYTSATGTWSILPPGIDGEVLKLAAGTPSWGTVTLIKDEKRATSTTNFVETAACSSGYALTGGSCQCFVGGTDFGGQVQYSKGNVHNNATKWQCKCASATDDAWAVAYCFKTSP